jgi:hypothetical protein
MTSIRTKLQFILQEQSNSKRIIDLLNNTRYARVILNITLKNATIRTHLFDLKDKTENSKFSRKLTRD